MGATWRTLLFFSPVIFFCSARFACLTLSLSLLPRLRLRSPASSLEPSAQLPETLARRGPSPPSSLIQTSGPQETHKRLQCAWSFPNTFFWPCLCCLQLRFQLFVFFATSFFISCKHEDLKKRRRACDVQRASPTPAFHHPVLLGRSFSAMSLPLATSLFTFI